MRSNLSTGLDMAKGLAVAWQVPIVGVHHMQGHLLTPRLVSALPAQQHAPGSGDASSYGPEFPFLSMLVSGGHSLLVHSRSLVDHEVLATTIDIAVGDVLDKIARLVVPEPLLRGSKTTMYGKILEEFAFPNGASDYSYYRSPATRGEEIPKRKHDNWDWSFSMPFAETKRLAFSFAGIASTVQSVFRDRKAKWMHERGEDEKDFVPHEERVALARILMQVCFEHLASRTVIALQNLRNNQARHTLDSGNVKSLVLSGGVAANQFLRTVVRSFLNVRGFSDIEITAPPPSLCTDNAAMIGWAGIEMFEAGWHSDLSCRALRKWSLDATAEDGGILGPHDWIKLS